GRIDNSKSTILGAIPFAGRDAMRTEDDSLSFGNLIEGFDENRALFFEAFEDEPVVHYLMANVERSPVCAQRAAYRLHRAIDTSAKAAGLSKDYFLNHSLA